MSIGPFGWAGAGPAARRGPDYPAARQARSPEAGVNRGNRQAATASCCSGRPLTTDLILVRTTLSGTDGGVTVGMGVGVGTIGSTAIALLVNPHHSKIHANKFSS